ncbi:hypothetical protein K450DRAFT_221828 [Umbelopsis ramanniana AG]|uniref:Uncharacterized protein n=1 Tax=Umbelopsis ramanniana AG TaxID=1314678 RepID=A0AAD5EH26_UMBRA|nr:uncharacterized protein K450DRAFT_221828 [Umbelopsis ramanniana AG]KAI8583583.1 hypothetical protein K450DRAFT_221828 [Umbelopsis ramanniana AG]
MIHCWKLYREPTVNANNMDTLDSLFSSDEEHDATASAGNFPTQTRTPKKPTNITKVSSPLSQPRQRHPPSSARQSSKRVSSTSKPTPTQTPSVEEEEKNLEDNHIMTDSKEEVSPPIITNNNDSYESTTESPTEDHSTRTDSVENLAATDASAFSHTEETNAVPEASTVDLAEADDDFITAAKRKRRRTRGGAKLQRQKMAQMEQCNSASDQSHVKKPTRKTSDEQYTSSGPKSNPKAGNEKFTHRHNHHSQAHEPVRTTSKLSPKLTSVSCEDVVCDDVQGTPKSSPRVSNTNITYANVAASTSAPSPVAEQRTAAVISSPQSPVSPALSQSSVVSNNEKRQSWYSPFSSGLELDIVPRPQPSLSSESVLFSGRPVSMGFDAKTGNYQHPDVLNALFRGGEGFLPTKGNALGLVPKFDNSEMRPNLPEHPIASAPYLRWDLYNNTRTPIAPPSSATERPLSMFNAKSQQPWDSLLSQDELEVRHPRHSWGAIGNVETEAWSTQPSPIQHERKKSNSGFSFFDRRLSTFSPRR